MNVYESNPSVLLSNSENAVYSELVAEVAHHFGGRLSSVLTIITVEYPALNTSTTYRVTSLETAAKIIARSQLGNCPATWRITYRPEARAEYAARRRYVSLSDYIASVNGI